MAAISGSPALMPQANDGLDEASHPLGVLVEMNPMQQLQGRIVRRIGIRALALKGVLRHEERHRFRL
ncbi:MAG TPA: hypothetical protein VK504_05240 [Vicinamibacterales bacterium]|jgi:hypothetical protein|nr:hypothetical protein [Vicinamibacterales bacterium]